MNGVLQHRVSVAAVVGAWMIVVLTWTPATYLVETGSGWSPSIVSIFFLVLLNFLPWMVVTPIVFWLAARFPISERRVWLCLLVQVGAGVLLLPLLTVAGNLLGALVLTPQQLSFRDPASTAITAFYAVPTYIAVAGIGQAVAYFDRYRTRERLLARAELRALEAQLNPHFLFNALNAVSAIGYRDPTLADRALSHLSELLRLTLASRPQEIPVRDEIGFIQGYLDLHSMIMPGQVSLDLSIEQSTWDAAVPTMLLQPLVENAIVHGVAKLTGGGTLSLAVSRVGERLRVVVGNDFPLNDHSSSGMGIGLGNLRERLRILYGERANLVLTREGQQANVVVELPYRESAR